jgi:hypothetical protein
MSFWHTAQPMTDPAHATAGPVAEPVIAAPDEPANRCGATVGKLPEKGGPTGPEPTRYGDWERKGRCIDF